MYEPKHLERWTMPDNYAGGVWPNYYSAGVGQSRDSDALERANFDTMVALLDEVEPESEDNWQIVRESHWAVGWVEWIAIHQDREDLLKIADKACGDLESYPVLDEFRFSEYEDEECAETWANCYDGRERIQYFRNHSYTGSVAELLPAVRGDWHAAANLLHCPSDILY